MEARSCLMVTWELSCPGPSFLQEDQTVPINQCHGLFLFMFMLFFMMQNLAM